MEDENNSPSEGFCLLGGEEEEKPPDSTTSELEKCQKKIKHLKAQLKQKGEAARYAYLRARRRIGSTQEYYRFGVSPNVDLEAYIKMCKTILFKEAEIQRATEFINEDVQDIFLKDNQYPRVFAQNFGMSTTTSKVFDSKPRKANPTRTSSRTK